MGTTEKTERAAKTRESTTPGGNVETQDVDLGAGEGYTVC